MTSFYTLDLTMDEKRKLFQDLCFECSEAKTSNDCLLWLPKSRSEKGYGIRTFTFRGLRYTHVRVHRLMYFLITGDHDLLDTNLHVSHKCHHKTCIRYTHLSLEQASVNNNRQICRYEGCSGHEQYGDCIEKDGGFIILLYTH